jgi:branched-chain amino acid transport system permease protein
MNYLWNALILISIYGLLNLGNNYTIGYSGLLNLACAAMFAIGSYSAALLLTHFQMGFLPTVFVSLMISVVLSLIVGVGSLHYKRTSFALVSLAFQLLILSLIKNLQIFGGALGIKSIPHAEIVGISFNNPFLFFLLAGFFLALGVIVSIFLQHSQWALSLQAVRDDEVLSLSLGKRVKLLRLQSFVVSSMYSGLAGILFATHYSYVDSSSFSPDESIFLLLALICGGTCNTKGPLLGALIAVGLPELLRYLGVSSMYASALRNIIFAIVVLVLMRIRPQGLSGKYEFR